MRRGRAAHWASNIPAGSVPPAIAALDVLAWFPTFVPARPFVDLSFDAEPDPAVRTSELYGDPLVTHEVIDGEAWFASGPRFWSFGDACRTGHLRRDRERVVLAHQMHKGREPSTGRYTIPKLKPPFAPNPMDRILP